MSAQSGLGLTIKGQIAVRLANLGYSPKDFADGQAALERFRTLGEQFNRLVERGAVVWDRYERMGKPSSAEGIADDFIRSVKRLRTHYEQIRADLRASIEVALSRGWITRDEAMRGSRNVMPDGLGDGGLSILGASVIVIVVSILGAVIYAIYGIPRAKKAAAEGDAMLIEANGYMAALNSRLDELPADQVASAIATVKSSGTSVQSPSFLELTTAGAAGGIVPILALGGFLFLLSRRRR